MGVRGCAEGFERAWVSRMPLGPRSGLDMTFARHARKALRPRSTEALPLGDKAKTVQTSFRDAPGLGKHLFCGHRLHLATVMGSKAAFNFSGPCSVEFGDRGPVEGFKQLVDEVLG
jgi:hypothetical protein